MKVGSNGRWGVRGGGGQADADEYSNSCELCGKEDEEEKKQENGGLAFVI